MLSIEFIITHLFIIVPSIDFHILEVGESSHSSLSSDEGSHLIKITYDLKSISWHFIFGQIA